MMNVCFTINQFRTTEEIASYEDFIVEKKITAVEIFYPIGLSEEGYKEYTNNIHKLKKLGVEVVMHLPFGANENLCLESTYNGALQTLLDGIEYSKQFATKKYTLHLGTVKDNNRQESLNRCVDALEQLCDKAYPAAIMIENMPVKSQMGYAPTEILEIIQRINRPNIKFILDTGHAHVSEYEIQTYLDLLRPYLHHIHLNDNNGTRDEHRRMGEGTIDFKKFFTSLQDYEEFYCLEILYKSVEDLRLYYQDLNQYFI